MCVYLRAKFEVSSIILTSFRQRREGISPLPTSKRIPKKLNQIRVKDTMEQLHFIITKITKNFSQRYDCAINNTRAQDTLFFSVSNDRSDVHI